MSAARSSAPPPGWRERLCRAVAISCPWELAAAVFAAREAAVSYAEIVVAMGPRPVCPARLRGHRQRLESFAHD